MFLLEPFGSEGAAAGHEQDVRIGQTEQVFCTTLYMRGTVEERTLWYRARKAKEEEALAQSRDARNDGGNEKVSDGGLSMLAGGESSSQSAAANDLALQYMLGMVAQETKEQVESD